MGPSLNTAHNPIHSLKSSAITLEQMVIFNVGKTKSFQSSLNDGPWKKNVQIAIFRKENIA